jgi:hypothetical protein
MVSPVLKSRDATAFASCTHHAIPILSMVPLLGTIPFRYAGYKYMSYTIETRQREAAIALHHSMDMQTRSVGLHRGHKDAFLLRVGMEDRFTYAPNAFDDEVVYSDLTGIANVYYKQVQNASN